MDRRYQQKELIRTRLSRERGVIFKNQGLRIALVYPSPYRLGMSSLGFQTIYRLINTETPHTAERAFVPDDDFDGPLVTYESGTPVGNMDVVAFSLAYELEAGGLVRCLVQSGLAPLAHDRQDSDPLVLLGGPITFSNPLPFGPFVDAMILGDGEPAIGPVLERISELGRGSRLLESLAGLDGVYVPSLDDDSLDEPLRANDAALPAHGPIITPDSELGDMHLVEVARGCPHTCTFCVMRRTAASGMRPAPVDRILGSIPPFARRVGLVGAAVTDHPRLLDIVGAVVQAGREVGLSSLRADRLTPELVELLGRGGNKTLTTAIDGASDRIRRRITKGIRAEHIERAAELARAHGMSQLKLYAMVGLPEETEEDIAELAGLLQHVGSLVPTVAAINPFVAKRRTPLADAPYAGIHEVEDRFRILRKALEPRVTFRAMSSRWGWVEYALAQGGSELAPAILDAYRDGLTFNAWKEAIARHAPEMAGTMNR